MEQDRFANNNALFIIGIICLVSSIALFFFSMFILPYLLWNLYYNVPGFIHDMISYFEDDYLFQPSTSRMITWLIFFIPCLITGFLSYVISNRIDNKLLQIETHVATEEEIIEQKAEKSRRRKESMSLTITILVIAVVIVALIFLFHGIIRTTPP